MNFYANQNNNQQLKIVSSRTQVSTNTLRRKQVVQGVTR